MNTFAKLKEWEISISEAHSKAIRIYTNQGYEDIKLGKRIAKLKELYSVYKSAL